MFVKSLNLVTWLVRSPIYRQYFMEKKTFNYLNIFTHITNGLLHKKIIVFESKLINQLAKICPYCIKYQNPYMNSVNTSLLFVMKNNQESRNVKLKFTSKILCHCPMWPFLLSSWHGNFVDHNISNYRKFSTKPGSNDLHGRIYSLKAKKRIHRKKRSIDEHGEENAEGFQLSSHHTFQTFDPEILLPEFVIHKSSPREFQIVAYATADEYDLGRIADGVNQQGLYYLAPIVQQVNKETSLHSENVQKSIKLSEPENVLHFSATYHVTPECREMYVFRDGVVVFWNIPILERKSILRFLQPYEDEPYNETIIHEEAETLIYTYTDSNTRLKPSQDLVLLNETGPLHLEKFAFSNALAMSVKLGIWEASLDSYIDNIEFVTEELRNSGRVPLSEEQVLQRMGELFALRHLINLSSDLLDTPDFYWEHENLALLFNKTANHLSIHKRTSVMNVKLGHCIELMDLLKSHLNQHHSARLEWIIIILIMIEIFFEIIHFIK